MLRFLEIEALAGLPRVAPASMATPMGSKSELFPFSSSEISSDCDAMIMTQQIPRWLAASSMMQRITAGFKHPLDR